MLKGTYLWLLSYIYVQLMSLNTLNGGRVMQCLGQFWNGSISLKRFNLAAFSTRLRLEPAVDGDNMTMCFTVWKSQKSW